MSLQGGTWDQDGNPAEFLYWIRKCLSIRGLEGCLWRIQPQLEPGCRQRFQPWLPIQASMLISEPLGVHASLGALDHILHTTCWMKLHHLWAILKKPSFLGLHSVMGPRIRPVQKEASCPNTGGLAAFFMILPCAYGA